MKVNTLILLLLAFTLCGTMVFAAGGGAQSSSTTQSQANQRVTTNVTPRPLTVAPQYGEARFHPQPATSYSFNPRYPQQPAYSNTNGFPIVQEKISIHVAMPYHYYVLDYEDNDQTRYLEELTNIRVEFDLLPQTGTSGSTERLNLMFSSGAPLPDVFYTTPLTPTMIITLGQGGLLIPLQEFVTPDLMHNYIHMITDFPTVWAAAHSADGNVYALATGNDHMVTNQQAMRMWINVPFLETLSMNTPTTTEEFYQYLVAVRDRDPNGNGLRDEIPLISDISGWMARIDGFIMNAFIYNDTTNATDPQNRWRLFIQPDGRIDSSYDKPEWRQGLEYMTRLHTEGLLAPESFTIVQDQIRAIVEAPGPQRVGAIPNGGNHNFAIPTGTRRNDFTTIPPLRGPNGVQQAWFDQYNNISVGRFAISKDSLIPEIAIKWADAQMTPDFATRQGMGILGRDWLIPPDGTPAVSGGQARSERILLWGTPTNAYWAAGLGRGVFFSYDTIFQGDVYELEYVLWRAYEQTNPYRFMRGVPRQLPYSLEESRIFTDLNTSIIQYVEQFMAQVVTGRIPLNDSTWDTYIRDLDRMGLPRLLSTVQGAFDRGWARTLGYNR